MTHDQNEEPLDKETDKSQDSVHPAYNADSNPVSDPDEEFEPPGIVFVDKKLVPLFVQS
jgi:hypothetical protein